MRNSKKPVLTIAIPAYNVENYIRETVESITRSRYADDLEILIINDGSKDNTKKVGAELEKEYGCVKLANKTNGGHGSAVNAGIKHATGKYFRLLDGDDWFDTEEFDRYMEKLVDEDVDLVLTDLVECFLKMGLNRPVSYYVAMPTNTELKLAEVEFPQWGPMLPTTTIKTALLHEFGLKLDEHCYYVDQEYNLMCYVAAKTVKYYPLAIYQYRLERDGQSMETASLIRNVYSHEKVCLRLLSEYKKHEAEMSETQKKYLENRVLIPMCNMQYMISVDLCKSREAFNSFDSKLKKYRKFYENELIAGRITRVHRKTGGRLIKVNKLLVYGSGMRGRLTWRNVRLRRLLLAIVCLGVAGGAVWLAVVSGLKWGLYFWGVGVLCGGGLIASVIRSAHRYRLSVRMAAEVTRAGIKLLFIGVAMLILGMAAVGVVAAPYLLWGC